MSHRDQLHRRYKRTRDISRSLWKVINSCIPSKDKIILTYHKNTLDLANDFNQFFQSVGKRAAETAEMLALQNNLNISTELEPQNRRSELFSTELFKFTPASHAQKFNA
jgi:hypothetical protein